MKFDIFGHHRSFYEPIQEDLMKWLNDNWARWVDEKEEWFDAAVIDTVPPEMLPVAVLNKLGGVERRRASLDKLIKTEDEAKKAKQKKENQLVLGDEV